MNAIARLCCAAALLAVVMPVATARGATRDAPPAAAPSAAQAKDESAQGGSGKAARLKHELDHKVETLRTYSAGRRDEAVANARRAVEDLDRQMQTLQQQMDQRRGRMSQAARTRSQATMTDLRKRRNTLAEWLGSMRHSSTAAWGEVRAGFVKSYYELADALRKASTEYEQDENSRGVD